MAVDIGSVTAAHWSLAHSGHPNCYRIFRRNWKAQDFPHLHLKLVSPIKKVIKLLNIFEKYNKQ